MYTLLYVFVCLRWYMRAPRQMGFTQWVWYIYENAYFMNNFYVYMYIFICTLSK